MHKTYCFPRSQSISVNYIFSKLYYCSTVWSGTTQKNIKKLQVQNFAARIVTGTRKYDHITPALDKLGWLSVYDSLLYRDAIMMYKIVHGTSTAKRSYFNHAALLWNSLDPMTRNISTLRGFKKDVLTK